VLRSVLKLNSSFPWNSLYPLCMLVASGLNYLTLECFLVLNIDDPVD
jgi:hypothetical protein